MTSEFRRTAPPRATLLEILSAPPPKCTCVKFRIQSRPGRKRIKFARRLALAGANGDLNFRGYIKRVSNEFLEVCVTSSPVADETDLGSLWLVLRDWKVRADEVTIELENYAESHFLGAKFQILHPDGEQDGWSAQEADLRDVDDDRAFSVVSSLK